MTLLSILAVPLVIGMAVSWARRGWWDRRAAARHHQAIEVLGRITKEQAEAAGAVHNGSTGAHSNLRVIPTETKAPPPPPPRRRVVPSRPRDGDTTQSGRSAPPEAPPHLPPPAPPDAPAPQPAQPAASLHAPPSRLPRPVVKDVPRPPTGPPVVRRPDLTSTPAPPAPDSEMPADPPAAPAADAHAAPAADTAAAPAADRPPAPNADRAAASEPPTPDAIVPAFRATAVQAPDPGGTATSPPALYFDDTPPVGIEPVGPLAEPSPGGSADPRHPRHSPRPRPRTLIVAAAAVLVVVGAAVAGVVLSSRGTHAPVPRAVAPPPPTAPVATQTTAPPPTTAAPAVSGPIQQTAANGSTVWVYHVPAGAQVTLTASGRCWVDAHQNDSQGPTVFTRTMVKGQTQSLTGPLWIRLGYPAGMSITVNGAPLTPPPTPQGQAYDVQFVIA